jgi:hypothetical protein
MSGLTPIFYKQVTIDSNIQKITGMPQVKRLMLMTNLPGVDNARKKVSLIS